VRQDRELQEFIHGSHWVDKERRKSLSRYDLSLASLRGHGFRFTLGSRIEHKSAQGFAPIHFTALVSLTGLV
jgi:hypothetical protein